MVGFQARRLSVYTKIPIRRLEVVIDLTEAFKPEIPLEEFQRLYGEEPAPPRYRLISIEAVSCAEDGAPVLVSECGRCPKFVTRYEGHIYCRRPRKL